MNLAEFLAARLSDPIGYEQDLRLNSFPTGSGPDLECEGAGEYYNCYQWSQWHQKTVVAQHAIIAQRGALDHRIAEANTDLRQQGNLPILVTMALELDTALKHLATVYSDHPDFDPTWCAT